MLASILLLALPHIGTPIIKAGQQHNTGDIDITVKSSTTFKKAGVVVIPYTGATNATSSKLYVYPQTNCIIDSFEEGDIAILASNLQDITFITDGGYINFAANTYLTVDNTNGSRPVYIHNREWKFNYTVPPYTKITLIF